MCVFSRIIYWSYYLTLTSELRPSQQELVKHIESLKIETEWMFGHRPVWRIWRCNVTCVLAAKKNRWPTSKLWKCTNRCDWCFSFCMLHVIKMGTWSNILKPNRSCFRIFIVDTNPNSSAEWHMAWKLRLWFSLFKRIHFSGVMFRTSVFTEIVLE